MKRRSKKKQQEHTPDDDSDEPVAFEKVDPMQELDSRLGPVEGLVKELDEWRKETSAQLARLSAGMEADRDGTDNTAKRLEEIEERLGSLIALTEIISMEDNPFVQARSPQEPTLMQDDNDDKSPKDQPEGTIEATTAGDRSAAPEKGGAPEASPEEESSDHGRKVVPLRLSSADPPGDTGGETKEHDEPGEEVGRQFVGEKGAVGRYRNHPNDPTADALGAPAVLSDVGSRPTSAPVPSSGEVSYKAGIPPEADRRLRLLRLSRFVVQHLPVKEHVPFLGAYVASGWITRDELTEIQSFVQDLARSNTDYVPLPRHELHEWTILLLAGHDRGAWEHEKSWTRQDQPEPSTDPGSGEAEPDHASASATREPPREAGPARG